MIKQFIYTIGFEIVTQTSTLPSFAIENQQSQLAKAPRYSVQLESPLKGSLASEISGQPQIPSQYALTNSRTKNTEQALNALKTIDLLNESRNYQTRSTDNNRPQLITLMKKKLPSIDRNSPLQVSLDISYHSKGKSLQKKQRPYMNETGPGQYDLPDMTGSKSILADKKSGPSFSFGARLKKNSQFISKEYLRNFLGKESEDAEMRQTSIEVVRQSPQKVFMPSEQRFSEPSITSYKRVVPISYESNTVQDEKSKTGFSHYKGIGFGFGKRSDFTHMPQLVENPGPGQYENMISEHSPKKEGQSPDSKMLGKSISRLSLTTQNVNNRDSMSKLAGVSSLGNKEKRDIDHLSTKIYAKNLQHRIYGKDSPGPGFYHDQIDNIWNLNITEKSQFYQGRSLITIPKGKRHLSNVRVDYMVGPTSYKTLEKMVDLVSSKKNISIGREERNYDPIKYSGNNKILILKGLYLQNEQRNFQI